MIPETKYYKTSYTLPKLKVITLVETYLEDKCKYEYKAIDDNGKVLATKEENRACNGKTFIAALITKNTNYLVGYSLKRLFTDFNRLNTTQYDKRFKPYALAILPEHQEAYKEWLEKIDEHKLSNTVPR